MAEFVLEAQKRTVTGKKVSNLRAQGFVPGTVYGPSTEPISLQFPYRKLQVMLMKAGATNLIDLDVEGKSIRVLAKDVQRDFLKGTILHVDFFAVDAGTRIRTTVPLNFIGKSPVVESRKGILLTGPSVLSMEVLPKDLVNEITIDLAQLDEVGKTILVSDLNIGDEITILNDPHEMIARIVRPSAARAEEVLAMDEELADEGETDAAGEVEVIGKGRDDDEDE